MTWTILKAHCGFRAPWMLVVAFKSYKTRARWYANGAEINLEVLKRRVKTKSGKNPFKYFDGATMVSYQVPSKPMEVAYCRQEPTPEDCHDGNYEYDQDFPNFPASLFEVKMSGKGENAGRGVFAKVDIPEQSYLSAETSCHPVRFLPSTKALIEAMEDKEFGNNIVAPMEAYMHGYGYTTRFLVSSFLSIFVEVCR